MVLSSPRQVSGNSIRKKLRPAGRPKCIRKAQASCSVVVAGNATANAALCCFLKQFRPVVVTCTCHACGGENLLGQLFGHFFERVQLLSKDLTFVKGFDFYKRVLV